MEKLINSIDPEIQKLFLKYLDNNAIINYIEKGIELGLTAEQISMYARDEFNERQIEQIFYGFKNKLKDEYIRIYADPKFDENQMFEIRSGFESGLTLEQVQVYANHNIPVWRMRFILSCFLEHFEIDDVKLYLEYVNDIYLSCETLEETVNLIKHWKKLGVDEWKTVVVVNSPLIPTNEKIAIRIIEKYIDILSLMKLDFICNKLIKLSYVTRITPKCLDVIINYIVMKYPDDENVFTDLHEELMKFVRNFDYLAVQESFLEPPPPPDKDEYSKGVMNIVLEYSKKF